MTPIEKALIDELRSIRRQQQEIIEMLARIAPAPSRSSPARHTEATALAAAIVAAAGNETFTVAELIERASVDDGPGEELRAALAAEGGLNPKRVGKVLRRMSEADLGTLALERVGEEHGRALWRVAGGVGLETTKAPEPVARARHVGAQLPRRRRST